MNRQDLLGELIENYAWSEGTFSIWEEAGFRCAYCGRHFLQSLDSYKQAKIDHLLPQSRYPNLIESPSNLVLACDVCNSLKRNWDPNEDGERSADGESNELPPELREELFNRALRHVQRRRIEREHKFLREKELITKWLAEQRPESKPKDQNT